MVRGPQAVCASASRDVARRAQRTPLAVCEPTSCGHVQSQGLPELPAKDTQAISAHFRFTRLLSCGYVQLPRLLWPCAEPSPAVTRHAGLSQGHQDTLRCTRLLSCGHVQVPRLLWSCEEPSLAGAQPSPAVKRHADIRAHCAVLCRLSCGHVHSQVREKTRTKPLKHLTAHVDPQPHVRPTTPD